MAEADWLTRVGAFGASGTFAAWISINSERILSPISLTATTANLYSTPSRRAEAVTVPAVDHYVYTPIELFKRTIP